MRWMPLLSAMVLASTVLAGCATTDDGDEPPEDPHAELKSAVDPDSYSVFPGAYNFTGYGARPLHDGPFQALPMEEVTLSSELDGADIDLTLWRPETPDDLQVPVIIQASPYYSDSSELAGIGGSMTDHYVPHGYAFVQLAIRSTGNSGGCDDFRGPKMTADMSQAIDWLVEQEWTMEAVALIGISYVGTTPWYAAGSGNPHVKTIVPISGSTNAWEVYNRNGTPEVRSPVLITTYAATAAANPDRTPQHKAENFACAEVYEGWATGAVSGAIGDRFNAEWWQERNAKPQVEANYEGSIFLIHGLEDWNVDPAVAIPWTDQLNRSGLKVKHWLGQWGHDYPSGNCHPESPFGPTCRWDWGEVLLRWFDSELKGLDVDTGPPVQVQDNSFAWRDELHWPPHDATWMSYNLSGDGALTTGAGTAGETRLVVPEPGYFSAASTGRGDEVLFRLGPLAEDLHIAGLPKVHVTVRPDGPGGTIGAFLYDEARGERTRIGWTAMNLRFADGTETPSTVVPNEPLLARMQIQPMDALVPAGHTLVLRLAIDTPTDRIYAQPLTPVTVTTGPEVHSVLELPIVERGPEAFFEPPRPEE